MLVGHFLPSAVTAFSGTTFPLPTGIVLCMRGANASFKMIVPS